VRRRVARSHRKGGKHDARAAADRNAALESPRWSSPTGRSAAARRGRIGIDPYDEALLQPSSVDVRVDRFFRVFRNSRYPYIDVKQPQEELTELVEIDDDRRSSSTRASSCSARRSSA
jgi:hypothetical protein